MNRIKNSSLLLAALSIMVMLVFTSGCVMQQGISMNANNSGWATTDLVVDDFFIAVLDDFATFTPEGPQTSIMDASVDDFLEMLQTKPSASNITLVKTGASSYFFDFDFTSLHQFLLEMNKLEPQSILTVGPEGKNTAMKFYLDLKNYPELAKMIPFLADPNFETFGPLYNEGLSVADYLDMISYILGEEGPDAIMQSVISIRITTPTNVISQKGGTKTGANSVRFDIPLIDILLLAKPISFSAIW
ncbi:MAG: hypothetical protein CVV52_15910 [Spirochaetae bacterium HGW-Spirochaetae-8]|jgi:hypothetical protein|nr:MAG: hypothetical protein CVV52_15910 [Spirochaetae bacterium HGW-Spirochaetae-8]